MSEQSKCGTAETPRQLRKSWVYIMLMVNIVFILLLMTLGIIALKEGNYLPETDLVFIAGKKTDVSVGDKNGKGWETNEEIDIFNAIHLNEDGEITVESQKGESIIAPGTKASYSFTMYNNSNLAVLYELDLDLIIKLGKKSGGGELEEQFPMKAKIFTDSGEYLLGSKTKYAKISDSLEPIRRRVLGAESFETFNIEFIWEFEGTDEIDTAFGDMSSESDMSIKLIINAYAEEHADAAAKGGTPIDESANTVIAGSTRWVWIMLLLINTAVLIFYVAWLLNKRLQKW